MVEKMTKKTIYRQFNGEVTNAKGNKTVQVLVKNKVTHPKYHKQYLVTRKYQIHDEKGEARVGDLVLFRECRPLSKTKRWRLIKIEKKA